MACSAFDLALHDAFGVLHGLPTYETYDARFMNADLAAYLEPAEGSGVSFEGRYPADYLVFPRPRRAARLAPRRRQGPDRPLRADRRRARRRLPGPAPRLDRGRRPDLPQGQAPGRRPGLGLRPARQASAGSPPRKGSEWLTADFNCTVTDPAYVVEILERLLATRHPRRTRGSFTSNSRSLTNWKPTRSTSGASPHRKPLFLDESAHDWRLIRLGRELGWTGVALKTCKTQTGALLALCWARAHGMALMVQDLTNPMLAQVPHVLLAAHAGTIMGVETNAMQFYPEASAPEAAVHPGLYRRRNGTVDLSTIRGPGFGYRSGEIHRALPEPAATFD